MSQMRRWNHSAIITILNCVAIIIALRPLLNLLHFLPVCGWCVCASMLLFLILYIFIPQVAIERLSVFDLVTPSNSTYNRSLRRDRQLCDPFFWPCFICRRLSSLLVIASRCLMLIVASEDTLRSRLTDSPASSKFTQNTVNGSRYVIVYSEWIEVCYCV